VRGKVGLRNGAVLAQGRRLKKRCKATGCGPAYSKDKWGLRNGDKHQVRFNIEFYWQRGEKGKMMKGSSTKNSTPKGGDSIGLAAKQKEYMGGSGPTKGNGGPNSLGGEINQRGDG